MTASNARLAALSHVLAYGPGGVIDVVAVHEASAVLGWHMHEARRLRFNLDTPPDLVAAIRLDPWLIAESSRSGDHRVPTSRVYQLSPSCVPDPNAMRTALATLTELGQSRPIADRRGREAAVHGNEPGGRERVTDGIGNRATVIAKGPETCH
jgi:hypothetical protein